MSHNVARMEGMDLIVMINGAFGVRETTFLKQLISYLSNYCLILKKLLSDEATREIFQDYQENGYN